MALQLKYQNVRGLRSKLVNFMTSLQSSNEDIIGVTETWLNDSIHDAELCQSGFQVFRRDRDYNRLHTDRGGGCLLAVREGMAVTRIEKFETTLDFLEDLWVKVELGHDRFLYICVTYISTVSNRLSYAAQKNLYLKFSEKVIENMQCINHDSLVFFMGDYNCPGISWTPTGRVMSPDHVSGAGAEILMDAIALNNLMQFNPVVNTNGSHLDLVFSNIEHDSINIIRSADPLVDEDDYHPTLLIVVRTEHKHLIEKQHKLRNFRKANYESINNKIGNIDWSVLNNMNISDASEFFYGSINKIIEEDVPKIRSLGKFPIWYDKKLIQLVKTKERAHKKYKQSNLRSDYSVFQNLRRTFKKKCNKRYKEYICEVQKVTPNNIKKFWSFTKAHKKTNTYPSAFKNDVAMATAPRDICNMFSASFQCNFKASRNIVNNLNNDRRSVPCSNMIENFCFSPEEVGNVIMKIDNNKNGGPDGIPNIFLRQTHNTISIPLAHIFNNSLSVGVCPERFKESFMVPIYKSGNKSEVKNYRPVSILNAFSKIFEKLIHDRLFGLIKHLISRKQHGFVANRSTVSNLVSFTSFVANALADRSEVHTIYTDFSKAFDRVNIKILLNKLHQFGIRGRLFKWFQSYLTNRKTRVAFNGHVHHPFMPPSGVPQGSVLGPLLFIIFINDLPIRLKMENLLFADDLKLFARVNNINDAMNLQNDIDRLIVWCESNDLDLNIDKCFVVKYHRKISPMNFEYRMSNKALTEVTQIKDLGVFFDCKLKFNVHISHIVRKAYQMLGFVMRMCKDFVNLSCMFSLYSTLVRSVLEYASVVWNPFRKNQVLEVERIQKKFSLFMSKKTYTPYMDYKIRLHIHGLISLEGRREKSDVIFLFKILNNIIDTDMLQSISFGVPRLNARFAIPFRITQLRTNDRDERDPLTRIQKTYNSDYSHIDMFTLSLIQVVAQLEASLRS